MWIYIIIGIIILLIIGIVVALYNGLIGARNKVQNAWSQIDVQLKRRADLIPNLVETVKGYAKHEKGVFERVTEARSAIMTADTVKQSQEANDMLTGALKSLFAVAENYPDLKANQNFLELQAQLEGTENRIAVARKDFNDAVNAFNTGVRKFPKNILASLFGFESKAYLKAKENSEDSPEVSF